MAGIIYMRSDLQRFIVSLEQIMNDLQQSPVGFYIRARAAQSDNFREYVSGMRNAECGMRNLFLEKQNTDEK